MQMLLVEDNQRLRTTLQQGLREAGHAVDTAADGDEALEKLDLNPSYDLLILDLMLPKTSGLVVLDQLRKGSSSLPVLVLTAKGALADKVRALDLGADDYLTKPFAFAELMARIRALLRRGKKTDLPLLTLDTLSLDPATCTAQRNGTPITLTAREYGLLDYFLRNPGRVLSKTELLEHVWDCNYEGLSNIVETYVKYLRKKLRTAPQDKELIHTLRGLGYLLKSD
ncbi:MAG: response regulator transcription factor [Dehalococcoidia bacterium]